MGLSFACQVSFYSLLLSVDITTSSSTHVWDRKHVFSVLMQGTILIFSLCLMFLYVYIVVWHCHFWGIFYWYLCRKNGEGNGNPPQCSCLENPRDGGAWRAAIYGVTQSRTWLKWLRSSRAWPCPSEQDSVSPSVSLSHKEASISLLSFSIRGQTDWKPQSQKTNQSEHMDHSLV